MNEKRRKETKVRSTSSLYLLEVGPGIQMTVSEYMRKEAKKEGYNNISTLYLQGIGQGIPGTV